MNFLITIILIAPIPVWLYLHFVDRARLAALAGRQSRFEETARSIRAAWETFDAEVDAGTAEPTRKEIIPRAEHVRREEPVYHALYDWSLTQGFEIQFEKMIKPYAPLLNQSWYSWTAGLHSHAFLTHLDVDHPGQTFRFWDHLVVVGVSGLSHSVRKALGNAAFSTVRTLTNLQIVHPSERWMIDLDEVVFTDAVRDIRIHGGEVALHVTGVDVGLVHELLSRNASPRGAPPAPPIISLTGVFDP